MSALNKRPFRHGAGCVVDEYMENGTSITREISTEAVRAVALRGRADLLDGSDRSVSSIEDLLSGIRRYDARAIYEAKLHASDHRVTETLVEMVSEAPPTGLIALGQVLADVGDKSAADALRLRRTELLGRVPAVESPPNDMSDGSEFALRSCAVAGVFLDPHDAEAADLLVRMSRSRDRLWSGYALTRVTELVVRGDATAVGIQLLRARIEELRDTDDIELFVRVAQYFFTVSQAWTAQRCETFLPAANTSMRAQLYHVVGKANPAEFGLALLCRWVEQEPSVRLAVDVVGFLGAAAPAVASERILSEAFSDPSPSLRLAAVLACPLLPRAMWQRMVEVSLKEEPDEFLRELMRQRLAPPNSLPSA